MPTALRDPATTREPYVRVIGKAVAALDVLRDDGGELTVPDVARRLGMSRSTVHRLLSTLERHHLVERTEAGGYQLGMHLFQLGSAVRVPSVLARSAATTLVELAERFSASGYLSVRDCDRALCVARVDRGPVLTTVYKVGDTLPLYMGAGPSILLAALPEVEIDRILSKPLQRVTERGVADLARIRARLRAIAETGISYAPNDVQMGLAAMGAPVKDNAGSVIAAVSVLSLSQWFDDGHKAPVATALRQAARKIASQVGSKSS